jgi:hypothetical protein
MANPFVGEVRMFAGNFAPLGWLTCEGQLLPISEFETLFNLLGTTYGGDGEQTFQLPDLRGRIPLHQGNGFVLAQTGGVEQVMLTSSQVPAWPASFVCHGHEQYPDGQCCRRHERRRHDDVSDCGGGERAHERRRGGFSRAIVATRESNAVSLRHLHHLVVRDFSDPELGRLTLNWISRTRHGRSICC